MIKKLICSLSWLITFLLMTNIALAGVPMWQIVSPMSSIRFTATQNGAPVTGKFNTFSGDIVFDPNQLTASHVKILVDMNSVSTSYGDISDTLKTSDWFNVAVFPNAVFTADKFIKTGANSYQAMGDLTLRDKKLPVTLNFVLDEYTPAKAHATGTVTIKRTLFGIGQGDWKKTDSIKDDVKIDFTLTAVGKSSP